jgi:hypothetical protein
MRIQHEPPMTVEFWRSLGRGTLILEYPLVLSERDSNRRAVDALIVLDGEFIQTAWTAAPDMAGRPVMVVQTKAYRTDAALVGQAVFSPILLRRRHATIGRIESVLLSPEPEPALSDLLQRHGVREVTVSGPTIKVTHINLPTAYEADLVKVHDRLGGEMLFGVHLPFQTTQRPIIKVDAVILPDRPKKRTTAGADRFARELVPGARAIAVVSTRQPLGMYVSGFALVAQHLLRAAGAIDAQAIALVGKEDRALQFALVKFPGLSSELIASAFKPLLDR